MKDSDTIIDPNKYINDSLQGFSDWTHVVLF